MNDIVTDGLQPTDIERIRMPGEISQRTDLIHIQEIAKVLAKLMTSYCVKHGGMISLVQTNTIDSKDGLQVNLEIRG